MIKVASDCLEMVNNFHKKAPCHYSMILREIDHSSRSFQDVEIVHGHWDSNFDAHLLVKAVASLDTSRHIWPDNLPDICCMPVNVFN